MNGFLLYTSFSRIFHYDQYCYAGQKDENRCIPCFTVQSKRGMWCSIWAAEDKTCPRTEENMSANVMLDCFLTIMNSRHDKVRNIRDKKDILCICT